MTYLCTNLSPTQSTLASGPTMALSSQGPSTTKKQVYSAFGSTTVFNFRPRSSTATLNFGKFCTIMHTPSHYNQASHMFSTTTGSCMVEHLLLVPENYSESLRTHMQQLPLNQSFSMWTAHFVAPRHSVLMPTTAVSAMLSGNQSLMKTPRSICMVRQTAPCCKTS